MNVGKNSRVILITALFALLLLVLPARGCLTAPALRGEPSFDVIDQFVVIKIDEIRTRPLKNDSTFFVVLEATSLSDRNRAAFEVARATVGQGLITDPNLSASSLTNIVLTSDFKPPTPGQYNFNLLLFSTANPQKILDSYPFDNTYFVINACYRQSDQGRVTHCRTAAEKEKSVIDSQIRISEELAPEFP